MKRISIIILVYFLLLPNTARMVSDPSAFNPNYLISDEEIQNWQSMNLDDVQAFLVQNGSYLARWNTTDVDGATLPASNIIYRAAEKNRINPKYLLVKLQKEQSLITDSSPTQKQLDWATGYGVCDGCSMDDPSIQKFKGFGIQVDSGAGIMRWYYDNVNISPIVKRPNTAYMIDGSLVQPANFATAFLYTYTPHLHGNENFWLLWKKWFEQVYPDGTLAKSQDSSVIYLIANGQKRPFSNMTALVSRFDPKMIVTVAESELQRYETGPKIALPNYSILKSGNLYYLLDNDTLRPFADASVVGKLGYNPDEIIEITSDDMSGLAIGAKITADTQTPIGRLVIVKENKQMYYLKDGIYQFVSDPTIAKKRFPNLTPTAVSANEIQSYASGQPMLFSDGVLFGIKGSNKIYVTERGRKRHIPTEAVFNALGYSWSNIIWVDEFTGMNHPTGAIISPPMTTVIASTYEETALGQSALSSQMVVTPAEDSKSIGPDFQTAIDAFVVADAKTGEILAGKNIDTIRPMASFAKVMTAYRLFKEGVSLSRSVAYDPLKHKATYHNFRIAAGESVLNENLMMSLLVSSLNTPGNMLVYSVDKNLENFISRMNTQAKEWGLKHTTFKDINGEDVETVTTARDYLTLYARATDNIEVRRFLGMPSYSYHELVDKDGKPAHFDAHSNELMEKQNLPFKIIASKTGYLDEAGSGLAMTAERLTDSKQFIIITMGNPDNAKKFDEPERLAVWSMKNF